MNQSADNSFANSQSKSNPGRTGVQIDTFNSNPYRYPSFHDFHTKSLIIPTRLDPYENGLGWSTRLCELQEKEELKKRKAHTTYGT